MRRWAHDNPSKASRVIPIGVLVVLVVQFSSINLLPTRYSIPLLLLSDFLFVLAGHLYWDTRGSYLDD